MNFYLECITILTFLLLIAIGASVEEKANNAAYKEALKGKKADRFVVYVLAHVMEYWVALCTFFALGSFIDLLKHPYWNHPISYVAALVTLAAMIMLLAYMTRYIHRVSNGHERTYIKVMERETIRQMFTGV